MVLVDRGVSVERFDYARLSGDWAVLRLLTALESSLGAPPAAHLVVEPRPGDDDLVYAPARDGAFERRLLPGEALGTELLWRATFTLPLEVVEAPRARFRLVAADGLALALPSPWLRNITPRELALTRHRLRSPDTSRPALGNPRQLAALATAVAVTATSTPAVAVAGAGSGSRAARGAPAPATAQFVAAPDASAGTNSPKAYAASPTRRTPPLKVIHLFSSPSQNAPGTMSRGAQLTMECSSQAGAAALTFAAGSRRSIPTGNLHVKCTPAPGTHRHAHSGAAITTPRGQGRATATTPGATTPSSGTPSPAAGGTPTSNSNGTAPPIVGPPTPQPTSSHSAASAPHRPAPAPSGHHTTATPPATGGVPLTSPAASSASTPSSSSSVPTLSSTAPGFGIPTAWTGTVTTDPALTGAVTNLSGLLSNGDRPPSFLIPIYMEAGRRYNVPWEVLAAINAIESDYGRNLSTSSAGAVGWMQFEPSTWARYGMAVDGHSVPNPYDPRDAIFSAASYLGAAGAAKDIATAVYAYNHASWYVDEVLARARSIAGHAQYERATADRQGTYFVSFAATDKTQSTVRYRSGVLSHYDRLIAAANMVSAAGFPYLYGGGHEQPARFGPFDCSGSVSYVMQQAGYNVPTTVSGDIPSWKFPAGPGPVTIFYNPGHTFMRIGDRYFGTSGFARPGGGAGWFSVDKLPAGYLAQFREVHVPGLGVNSFAPGLGASSFAPPPQPLAGRSAAAHTAGSQSWSSFKSQVQYWMSSLGPFPGA